MIQSRAIATIALLIVMPTVAVAETVSVTLIVDAPILVIDQTTRLHVFAEILDGTTGNGIYGYALNVIESLPAGIEMTNVTQLGDPLDFFSDPGVFMLDGLHDVYGSDGDFFLERNRGLGGPFELLTIDLVARSVGDVTLFVAAADNAVTFGIPDAFLLQGPGAVAADFGEGVRVTVIPEPATSVLLCVAGAWLLSAHGRFGGGLVRAWRREQLR